MLKEVHVCVQCWWHCHFQIVSSELFSSSDACKSRKVPIDYRFSGFDFLLIHFRCVNGFFCLSILGVASFFLLVLVTNLACILLILVCFVIFVLIVGLLIVVAILIFLMVSASLSLAAPCLSSLFSSLLLSSSISSSSSVAMPSRRQAFLAFILSLSFFCCLGNSFIKLLPSCCPHCLCISFCNNGNIFFFEFRAHDLHPLLIDLVVFTSLSMESGIRVSFVVCEREIV